MDVNLHTANTAKLIGDTTRATMLISLMSGRAMTATELAHVANVSPQTASSHLLQLIEGKLLTLEKQGRHRYYRLASSEVAHALEALMLLTPNKKTHKTNALEPIYLARSCYDHIAGRLGVDLADALQAKGWLKVENKDFTVTHKGEKGLAELGLDLAVLKKQRRHFARQCLDWTERRHHVAGALGAALMTEMLERAWLKKDATTRVLYVTRAGREGLEQVFDVRL
jgi:DNA-binding transcriptional ArsR family regulator